MRKFIYIMAALLVLIGINTRDVEARRDVYATTYHGNSWYVDQDSIKRVGGYPQLYSVHNSWFEL